MKKKKKGAEGKKDEIDGACFFCPFTNSLSDIKSSPLSHSHFDSTRTPRTETAALRMSVRAYEEAREKNDADDGDGDDEATGVVLIDDDVVVVAAADCCWRSIAAVVVAASQGATAVGTVAMAGLQ